MSTSNSIEAQVQKLIDGIKEGKLLETFEALYAEDIVMSENGNTENRIGKKANREREKQFWSQAKLISATPEKVIIVQNHSVVEWTFEIKRGDNTNKARQIAVQHWKDNLIIKEEFWY